MDIQYGVVTSFAIVSQERFPAREPPRPGFEHGHNYAAGKQGKAATYLICGLASMYHSGFIKICTAFQANAQSSRFGIHVA
jgi:hypothetical protein